MGHCPSFLPGTWPGQCPCKEGYTGAKCDRCQFGYTGYPACVRCDCSLAGSVNEDPCSEPCLCKVRGVKADPEFSLRFLEKGKHSFGSEGQLLSKAARCRQNSPLSSHLPEKCDGILATGYVLGLTWAPGFFFGASGQWLYIFQRHFCYFLGETKHCISEALTITSSMTLFFSFMFGAEPGKH